MSLNPGLHTFLQIILFILVIQVVQVSGLHHFKKTKTTGLQIYQCIYRGSYMSVHVLLNLLNELRKRYEMRGLPIILSIFLQF